MATKMTKRELQSPDKFETTTGSWLEWTQTHPRETATAGGIALVVIVTLGIVFGSSEAKVDATAGGALSSALELAQRRVDAHPAAVPAEAGEKPEETFPSEAAKQQAVADALTQLRKDHAGSSSAMGATLSLADAQFKLGRFDEALALYDEFLAKAPRSNSLRFMGLEGRALALEGKKDFDGAMAAMDRLAAEAPTYKDRSLFGKARLLEQQSKWDDARKLYQELKDGYAESPVTRSSSDRLAALDFRHPAAAQAAADDGK
ncbi:tetratricopeptide repeat protein [Vulgatibacter incomptus]|uniref:Putative lipoprotein n=1 Tax=Vulgatibacter incomptus TaxID=1391653 RepID=A0A0K1PBN9_9BACT|nr:tetratricopeptide repeat protein [Vulgatibacter incomptus]AKU90953.1 putative lipoprotein [Vulgatibacter incomptus]